MKMSIKGTVHHIGEPRAAGQGTVTEVILNKKYHDPETGELKNEDYYPVQIWQDKFADFQKCFERSSRMEINGFINGRLVEKDGKQSCFMNFTGQKFLNY